MPEFTENEIKTYLPSLRAVFYGAGTVQAFARPILNSGVEVFSAWAANAVPVAEYTVAQIVLANNEQTKGMLSGALFEKMLPYATFLNTGRGAQVVESDLIRVLQSRPDLTAILDVTDPEPPEAGSALYTLENCILTPHIAGSSGSEMARMGEYMVKEYESFIANKPCKYEVTLEMLKTMA